MLSNAIDFRTRRKQRPKSADFENPEDEADTRSQVSSTSNTASTSNGARSASVTDILECVSLSPGTRDPLGLPPRVLEGRNSAPDMLAGDIVGSATLGSRHARARSRLSAAASAKQKLSTRWKWTKDIFKISGNFCPLPLLLKNVCPSDATAKRAHIPKRTVCRPQFVHFYFFIVQFFKTFFADSSHRGKFSIDLLPKLSLVLVLKEQRRSV